MRFRAKFVQENWVWFLICGTNLSVALDRFRTHSHSQVGFFNRSTGYLDFLTALMALLTFLSPKTTSWEMDAEGLHYRRLWINTKISWQDVTRIVSLWSGTYDFKIEYNRHGFGPRIGRILANPADREAFLESLRRFAPQAILADESSKRTLLA